MHRVAAKFVPLLLTDQQMEQRVAIRKELFHRAIDEETALKKPGLMDMTFKRKDSPHSGYRNLPRDPKQHAKFAPT